MLSSPMFSRLLQCHEWTLPVGLLLTIERDSGKLGILVQKPLLSRSTILQYIGFLLQTSLRFNQQSFSEKGGIVEHLSSSDRKKQNQRVPNMIHGLRTLTAPVSCISNYALINSNSGSEAPS
eukprot:scaffold23499_cov109-Cylindrotheca_fusiformis.AAC.3